LETSVETLEANVTSIEFKLGNLEANVETLETNVETLEANVETLEANVTSIEFKLGNLEANVETLETSVETLEANVTSIEFKLGNLEANVETLETNVETLEANVASIEFKLGNLEANVETLEANVASIELELGNLDSVFAPASVDNLSQYLLNLDTSTNLRGNVETLETNVETLETNVATIELELGNLDSLFVPVSATNLSEYLSGLENSTSIRGNVETLEAILPTINTNLQIVFNNVEAALHSTQYNIHTLKQRMDLLEGLNVFEPAFTMVSTNDATIVFRNLQKGTSVKVILTPSANDTIIHETNVHLDTLRIIGLEPSTAYTANIGSPDYFTVIEFTTPSSSDFSLTFVEGNVTMQGPLLSGESSGSLRVYVKDQSRDNITVYSSEIPGGYYYGAVVTFDVSGNVTAGNYVFEVKDTVTDVVLANLEF
jgi:chromosome segregation ATPase